MTSMDMNTYKIVFTGDSGVGKSSIAYWFINDCPAKYMNSTIGSAFFIKRFIYNKKSIRFDIWDTAGQERYRSLIRMYYINSIGCVCVFDVTSRKSFDNIPYWISNYRKHNNLPSYVIVLVANKCDFPQTSWRISENEIYEFANKENLQVIFTNCMDGQNIKNVFETLAKNILLMNDNYDNYKDHTRLVSTPSTLIYNINVNENNNNNIDISDVKDNHVHGYSHLHNSKVGIINLYSSVVEKNPIKYICSI